MDVETAYRRWSEDYDSVPNQTRDLDATALRASGLDRAGRAIVELGCGTGKNTLWLADGARSVVALDLSDAMLERARANVTAPNVTFVQHDLRAPWPLTDASADLIVGNLVLEHIAAVPFVFAEAARVLRPGGELFISEFHPFRQLMGGGAKVSEADGDRIEVFVHDVSEYVNAAIDAGFTIAALGEWRDQRPAAEGPAIPRILTLHGRIRTRND